MARNSSGAARLRLGGIALLAALAALPACASRGALVSLAPLPADRKVVLSPADLGSAVSLERIASLREAVVKRLHHDGSYELIGMFRSDSDDLIGYSKALVTESGSFAAGYYLGQKLHFRSDTERATGASLIDLDRSVDWADDAAFEELDRDGHQWGLLFFGRKSGKILVLILGGVPDLSPADFEALAHRKMEQLVAYDPKVS